MRFIWILMVIFFSKEAKAQEQILQNLPGIWQNLSDSTQLETWTVDSTGLKGEWLRLTDSDSLTTWKNLQILEINDTLRYIYFSERDTATFNLTLKTESELLFTNFDRNFPKVIHYRLPKKDFLKVEIYDESYAERIEFYYRRLATLP